MSSRRDVVCFLLIVAFSVLMAVAVTLHNQKAIPLAQANLNQQPFIELIGTGYATAQTATLAQWPNTPLLVAFWRSDCAPCMRELALLPALAKHYPKLPIALISLQDAAHTKAHLPPLPQNIHVLVATTEPHALLTAFGNDKIIALPYSIMRSPNGTLCSTHHGILAHDTLKQWLKTC